MFANVIGPLFLGNSEPSVSIKIYWLIEQMRGTCIVAHMRQSVSTVLPLDIRVDLSVKPCPIGGAAGICFK